MRGIRGKSGSCIGGTVGRHSGWGRHGKRGRGRVEPERKQCHVWFRGPIKEHLRE